QAKAAFEVHNSPLSENAAVAFEFGYNVQEPARLVLWEAQYGDFVNGAQVILDEFLTSGRAKWGLTPSLVLLLPHGYEGQGPDHSSARLERFLNAAADTNMRIANCTTAAQYFHLLRRQAMLLKTDPLPLVVMTPKSLLRHPRATSSVAELAQGGFQPVLDDPSVKDAASVQRVIVCTGKIYYDLAAAAEQSGDGSAVVRVEMLYPFPGVELSRVLGRYANAEEIVWTQEEPRNMGAWPFIEPRLREIAGDVPVRYAGRPLRASPAEGYVDVHDAEQKRIVADALAGAAGRKPKSAKTRK
ncbi:MAG TPA: hypothetical protein VF035_05160, partial [Longimicrobiales bacterium]